MRSLVARATRATKEQPLIRAWNARNEGSLSFLPFTALTFRLGRKRWYVNISFSPNVGLLTRDKEDHDREIFTRLKHEHDK
jgi:hypothetical protein